ncbi:hypothetical protein L0F63_007180, partial [Massospora cicadina]
FELKDELDMALLKLEAAQIEINKLESSNSNLALKLEAETKQLALKDVSIQDLHQQIDEAASIKNRLQDELNQFNNYVSELQHQLKDCLEKFERAVVENEDLQKMLESKTKSYEALMGSSQSEVSSLNLVVNELKGKVEHLQTSLANSNGTISKLKFENDASVLNFKTKLASFEEESSKNIATIETLEFKLAKITKEYQTLAKESKERDEEMNGLNKIKTTLQEELKNANFKVKKLEVELSSSAASKAELEKKYEDLDVKHQADRKRLAELAVQIATFVSGHPEEVEKLKAKIKEPKSKPNSPKQTHSTINDA